MGKSNCLLILLLPLLILTCNKKTPDEANDSSSSQNTGSYIFYVEKSVSNPNVQFPFDTLSEEQYSPDNTGKTYVIKFSSDGKEVSINNDSIQGTAGTESDLKKSYNLDKGVFAGGRFVIWPKDQPTKAELTIYGSGVPIIVSERGMLVKK
jgi:hypothetical protein